MKKEKIEPAEIIIHVIMVVMVFSISAFWIDGCLKAIMH